MSIYICILTLHVCCDIIQKIACRCGTEVVKIAYIIAISVYSLIVAIIAALILSLFGLGQVAMSLFAFVAFAVVLLLLFSLLICLFIILKNIFGKKLLKFLIAFLLIPTVLAMLTIVLTTDYNEHVNNTPKTPSYSKQVHNNNGVGVENQEVVNSNQASVTPEPKLWQTLAPWILLGIFAVAVVFTGITAVLKASAKRKLAAAEQLKADAEFLATPVAGLDIPPEKDPLLQKYKQN